MDCLKFFDMNRTQIELAIDKLGRAFSALDLSFHEMRDGRANDITSYWPGGENEDVIVCVFKGTEISEPFHRQDFFFINYAYRNGYNALSATYDNLIAVHENEIYVGQPYSGYALRGKSEKEIVILGVLVRKEAFFREFLPLVYADAALFRFFVNPQRNQFSDEFIHLSLPAQHAIRSLLELMVMEYTDAKNDTQQVLKSMLQTLLLEIARRRRLQASVAVPKPVSGRLLAYMDDHSDAVTLKVIANRFGYHPNYVSALLHRETGHTFSEILLEKRMERAALLLKNTAFPIEEIASLLGYGNASNFYKAFKSYYGTTPREYVG